MRERLKQAQPLVIVLLLVLLTTLGGGYFNEKKENAQIKNQKDEIKPDKLQQTIGLALPSLAASGISFNPTQVRQKRGRFDPRWNSDYLAFQLMAFW